MTTDWSDGYVSEINYTYGFYREMTPAILAHAALARGKAAPDVNKGATYFELGCGQGITANLLAAANPGIEFYATDFNPSQIAGAQELAREAGTPNLRFFDDSFEQLLSRTDLPDFDFIALHGIYSWISAENRANIVEFIRRRLKPGGLVYISYNTLPGWASVMPLRRLFVDAAADDSGEILQRIDGALKFVEGLIEQKPRFFQSNPLITERFKRAAGMPRQYLAHEYFNRDWTPFYFSDVVNELSAAKLTWVGPVHLLDGVDAINLSGEQQKFLAEISNATRRECTRDFMVNQQFRRDLFVKGALQLAPHHVRDRWGRQEFVLSTPAHLVPLKVAGPVGEVNLQEAVYSPILSALAHGPLSVSQLLADVRTKELGFARIQQALNILVGAGHLQPCLPSAGVDKRRERAAKINSALMSRSQWSSDYNFLASPVTGGGLAVDRISQLFMLALKQGRANPVAQVWECLESQGQRLVKDGVPMQSAEENIEELAKRHATFMKDHLPTYRQLQMV